MFTIETKSMLAKLMAKEGIKVVHRNVKTSRFNLETRTLTCPVWTDMSGDLYDLLMGHEIAHALFTPIEGWHDSIVFSGGNGETKPAAQAAYKNFLNVIEDARIEKLIKRQYPGLRKPMINGYKELLARDFFGLSAVSDYNNLYLVDKMNLAAKCGTHVNVKFTAKEQPYFDAMMAVETWDQVVDLANKLYAYSKTEQHSTAAKKEELAAHLRDSYQEFDFGDEVEHSVTNWDDSDEDDYEDDEDSEYTNSPNEWRNGVAETSEDRDAGGDNIPTPKTEEDRRKMVETDDSDLAPAPGAGPGAGACNVNEEDFIPQVHTDQAFRNAEDFLLEKDNVTTHEVNIPSVTLKDIVVPASIVNKGLYAAFVNHREEGYELLAEFKRKNEDYIGLLAKEFEMKKAAKSFAKAKLGSSGDIDITKLASFRTEDNIFRKTMAVYKGKSHGLILILDKSGSMGEHIEGAMEQIMVMAMFCRKVNIPFAAYSFTDNGYSARIHDFPGRGNQTGALKPFSVKKDDLIMGDLSFRELFNSKMAASDFTQAMANHLLLAQKLGNSRKSMLPLPDHERMGGTPLNEALVVLRDVVREFQATYRLDIVNTIVVHDGDSNGNSQVYENEAIPNQDDHYRHRKYFDCQSDRVVLHDVKENLHVAVPRHGRGMTIALMRWVQMTAGCGIFGFYITENSVKKVQYPLEKLYQNRQGIKMACRYGATPDQLIVMDQLCKEVIEEKFLESFSDGYTRLYFIPGSKELKTDGDKIVDDGSKAWTKSRLLREFKKVTRKRSVNRVLVSRFIQLIAE